MSDVRPIDAAISRLKRIHAHGAGRESQDPEPDLASHDVDQQEDLPAELLWPPPRLAHIHGLLSRITIEFWFAALVLIATVASAAWRDRPAEAGSWGTVAALLVVGLLLWGAYMRLLVLFNRATSAVRAGYPRQLVWHVAADWARDTPQVLRGLQSFERLGIAQRTMLLDTRVAASLFMLAGAVWITASFPFWLLLSAQGRLGSGFVWTATLLPAALCVPVSLFFRVREIRASYAHRRPDEEDRLAALQVRGWRSLYARAGYTAKAVDMGSRYRLAGAAAVLAVFVILMPLAVAAFSLAFPALLRDNTALYSTVMRAAALAPLRGYQPDNVTLAAGFSALDSVPRRQEALVALKQVQIGADSLAARYRGNGRIADAERIATTLEAAALAGQSALTLARGSRTARQGLEHFVLRPDLPRAVRWEAFARVSILASCGSLSEIVFGPGERYRILERRARAALVRTASDQEYFERVSGGRRCNFGLLRRALWGQ
ncbi:MAG: hypothetical protein ACT443_08525 [Gemmatimonadota bacterium]